MLAMKAWSLTCQAFIRGPWSLPVRLDHTWKVWSQAWSRTLLCEPRDIYPWNLNRWALIWDPLKNRETFLDELENDVPQVLHLRPQPRFPGQYNYKNFTLIEKKILNTFAVNGLNPPPLNIQKRIKYMARKFLAKKVSTYIRVTEEGWPPTVTRHIFQLIPKWTRGDYHPRYRTCLQLNAIFIDMLPKPALQF